ncbi:NAD-dependent epimerase/dehydratase family protein [Undibacterium sp. Ren11W]|uniref:NAD-dependent epimerase/dehydratase family protein n=1 Tax=Undibacterium sp. Ren11W TaxID=3413045 RepID=UPI003BF38596
MNQHRIKNSQRLGKPRLLIIGCGDVGMRLLPLLTQQFRIFALTSQPARHAELRAAGAIPITADLDQPRSLARLAGLANYVVHLAPPPAVGDSDCRTRNLIAILPDKSRLVYISTTGVYGNCDEQPFGETRTVAANNPRAKRRVAAERLLRAWAVRSQSRLAILRVPGIYAADRLPLERLRKGTPALLAAEDVYTNHIHADDLAMLIKLALFRAAPNRVYHAVDDSDLKMADYFDLVADHFQLPRPPRLTRAELAQQISPVLLSFMSESRRMLNHRIKQELGGRFNYPSVLQGVQAAMLLTQK